MAQFFEAVLPGSPLPPKIQTQSSTDPRFEVREDSRSLAEAEVAAPSHDVWLQLFDQLLQTEPPYPTCQVSDPPFEFVEGLWRDAPLAMFSSLEVKDPMGVWIATGALGRVRLLNHPLWRRPCKLQLTEPMRRPLSKQIFPQFLRLWTGASLWEFAI